MKFYVEFYGASEVEANSYEEAEEIALHRGPDFIEVSEILER